MKSKGTPHSLGNSKGLEVTLQEPEAKASDIFCYTVIHSQCNKDSLNK